MPTYQYRREDGSTFEIIQKISESALKTCPQTGQKVARIISGGAGVVYKGDGWYVTDYKNKSNGSSSQSGSNGNSASGSCCSTNDSSCKAKAETSS
ncbi:zinc ribbon domain-containing protein [Balneolaceae bacterium ANBcel3]|nr:zinc ribbon domain-containing protein [Balneolaceae bacterium ANBcel3]